MYSIDDAVQKMKMEIIRDVFSKHYDGIIEPISLNSIPNSPMDLFEGYSRRFILPEEYFQRDFDQSFVITHKNGEKTYVVTQTKNFIHSNYTASERLVYLADVDNSNNSVARAELRFNYTDAHTYFKDKPFAGFNGFERDSQFNSLLDLFNDEKLTGVLTKKWVDVGTRQLFVMNALSHALFDLPLYSDTLLTEFERPLWDNLKNNNHVSVFWVDDDKKRYKRMVFNNNPNILYKHNQN